MFGKAILALLIVVIGWALVAHSSQGAGHGRAYVVRPTDTLWSIAAANYPGDTREGVWKLRHRNHIAGTTIVPGERLVVP
ncbi:MAG TPA: LysM peptidoglycan-binding domain-containing protein [Gaiellaceae bacterium]